MKAGLTVLMLAVKYGRRWIVEMLMKDPQAMTELTPLEKVAPRYGLLLSNR